MVADYASAEVVQAVARGAHTGLSASRKTLPPWLPYDERGVILSDEIARLPAHHANRTETDLLQHNAIEVLRMAAGYRPLTIVELGAGSAAKSGLLLGSLVRSQGSVLYQPVDISRAALDFAEFDIASKIPGVVSRPRVANLIKDSYQIKRWHGGRTLAIWANSAIGTFSRPEAQDILLNLHSQLESGDSLLLCVDLVQDQETLMSTYDDRSGCHQALSRNALERLNKVLGANFEVEQFAHKVVWNRHEALVEMHLRSVTSQGVTIPPVAGYPRLDLAFRTDETIQTKSSYKFTFATLASLLIWSGFTMKETWHDCACSFALALATA